MIHIHNGILFHLKNEGNPVICKMDDLEGIVLSEINQTKTKPHDISYMRNLKIKKVELIGKDLQ